MEKQAYSNADEQTYHAYSIEREMQQWRHLPLVQKKLIIQEGLCNRAHNKLARKLHLSLNTQTEISLAYQLR